MKTYPSIDRFPGGKVKLHTFDKLDGSNLRFEWSKKRGWYKSGTRKRMFDETDKVFGIALPLFHETLAKPLEEIIKKQRWDKCVVFAEFFGDRSFAGYHIARDSKRLVLIDVSPHRKGILPPREFLKLFGEFGPNYLGEINWTPGFMQRVRNGEVEGISFEGVVGKGLRGKKLIMYKAKTKAWIDRVFACYGDDRGKLIVES